MVVENYPSGFITKSNMSSSIPQTVIEAPKEEFKESSKIGERVIRPSTKQNEINRIRKELRKEGLDIDLRSGKVVPQGYYYTNTGKLKKKQGVSAELTDVKGDYYTTSEGEKVFVASSKGKSIGKEVIVRGKVPEGAVEQAIKKYEAKVSDKSTSRDTVMSESGGVSKAYELQSKEEKQMTRDYSATLINTNTGVVSTSKDKLIGDGNGTKNNVSGFVKSFEGGDSSAMGFSSAVSPKSSFNVKKYIPFSSKILPENAMMPKSIRDVASTTGQVTSGLIVETGESLIKGAGKTFYAPNYYPESKPIINIGQSKYFSTGGAPLYSDPDVQNVALAVALPQSKFLTTGFFSYQTGKSGVEFVKEPSLKGLINIGVSGVGLFYGTKSVAEAPRVGRTEYIRGTEQFMRYGFESKQKQFALKGEKVPFEVKDTSAKAFGGYEKGYVDVFGNPVSDVKVAKVKESFESKFAPFGKPQVVEGVSTRTEYVAPVSDAVKSSQVKLAEPIVFFESKINRFTGKSELTPTYTADVKFEPMLSRYQDVKSYSGETATQKVLREQPFKFFKGEKVPFEVKDTSAPLRANVLEATTGDRYAVQSTLFGEPIISKIKEKGFIEKSGEVTLDLGKPREIEVIRTKAYGGEMYTVVEKSTGQSALQKFGFGENPLLSSKSIESTNPRFEIIDFINPSKNKFYDRPTTQSVLAPVEVKITKGSNRNTLVELYGRPPMANKIVEPIRDVQPKTTLITESVSVPSRTQLTAPTLKISSKYANDKGMGERISNVIYEEQYTSVPKIKQFNEGSTQRIDMASLSEERISPPKVKQFEEPISVNALESERVSGIKSGLDSRTGLLRVNANVQRSQYALANANIQIQSPVQRQDVSQVQIQSPAQQQDLIPAQILITKQKTEPITGTIPEYRYPPQNTPPITTEILTPRKRVPKEPEVPKEPIITTPPIRFDMDKPNKKKKKKVSLFVRKKGKFVSRGDFEDVGLAFKKGKDILESSASASFKVVEDNKPISFNVLSNKFTKSKREEGVVVQKREFRIGSYGEKQEITAKGIQASKLKRRLL